MKSLYELLEVEKTADQTQIKRGYFNQVRKYPPERFPEEFKALRAAYETLSDEKKRAEYDRIGAMPPIVAAVFQEAQKANKLGLHTEASNLYRTILTRDPKLTKVKEEYAWSLKAEGKSGKAIEVWESLCKQEPNNHEYAQCLAQAYVDRGWHKKATAQFRRAVEIDGSDADCWTEMLHCMMAGAKEEKEVQQVCREALKAVGENCDYIPLYVHAFLILAGDDKNAAQGYLQKILALMRAGLVTEAMNMQEALLEMVNSLFVFNLADLFPYIQDMADLLPDKSKTFLSSFEEVKQIYTVSRLKEQGFSALIHDLLVTIAVQTDSDEDRHQILIMEWIILSEQNTYRPQLARLKKELPELYALHKNFFDEAMRTRNPEKMMRDRDKKLDKLKARNPDLEDDEDEEEQLEPLRRTAPKVGRNDPCPCGSGKKYKKCCGA
ncbi:MAG: DnaJ domain-containing protein [Treponema sp.]|jgi:Flp pilus assembly protein TadD|nr:DnaJ domain-containing protein [Treponema sp.]